ncbi:MAG: putative metal-binding motif-containing protein, partial [Myxococcota bacterium]
MTPSPPRGRRRRGGSALRTGTGGLIILSLAACAPPSNFELVPTGRVGRALAGIEGVEATAFLVPVGRAPPSDGLALTRGDDGVSFSGFVEAAPGAYALEVVFRGQPTGAPGPVFLGRWTSDVFTVEAGAVVEARFSQPIDPIGRPEDEGDLDRDGLGLLDEYLWSADPNASDADEDGLRDGVDCDPGVATETFQILAGGSIEDCDADGVRRPDLPFPGSGLDCDDRAPEVRPGAVDDCSDALDQDCNPATCPSDDRDPPVLEGTLPAAGAAVGCHVELEATVADDDAASLELVASDLVPSGPDRLAGTRLGAGLWRFPDFNTLAGANSGLREGRREVVLNAVDAAGNRSAFALSFSFDFSRPALRSFEPAAGGNRSAPYEVAIQAPGAARIGLFAAPRAQDGTYFADERASALGEVAAETARFTVDPADLSEAPWMLYAVVKDRASVRSMPPVASTPKPITLTHEKLGSTSKAASRAVS